MLYNPQTLQYEPASNPLSLAISPNINLPVGTRISLEGLSGAPETLNEREFFIDNLLVRIHLIIEMILVDRPCAMGITPDTLKYYRCTNPKLET